MFEVCELKDRKIIIRGIGRMYYEKGFPIQDSIDILKSQGFEISYIHLADELLKNGWDNKRIVYTLSEIEHDKELVGKFLECDYDDQREMIFDYLFGNREIAKEWFRKSFFNWSR